MLIDSIWDWNPWWEKSESISGFVGHPREELSQLITSLDDSKVTIISGVRRAGKTTLMYQMIAYLLESGVNPINILFLGLEDPAFVEHDLITLITEYRKEHTPKGKIYLFLDEIQSKDDWERIIRKEIDTRKESKVIISGSSSTLLSGKHSAILTGRNLTYLIYPLSFKSFLSFMGEQISTVNLRGRSAERVSGLLRRYLDIGGFPEIVLQDEVHRRATLNQYFNDIIYRDIIHLQSANPRKVYTLASYLLLNVGNTITLSSLRRALGLSYDAIRDYLHYLEQARLFYFAKEFTFSPKPVPAKVGKMKVYCTDIGMARAVHGRHSRDYGRFAENAVYLKLLTEGLAPGFFRGRKEIDFVAVTPDNIVFLVNVTMTDKIPKREFDGINEFIEKYPRSQTESIILTEGLYDEVSGIKLMPLWKWLISELEL